MVKHENFIKIGNALSVLDKNIENFSASYPTHSMVLYVAVYCNCKLHIQLPAFSQLRSLSYLYIYDYGT